MADGSTRIGLIGAGNISATHARAIAALADATLVAVYGPTLERAEALAEPSGAAASDTLDGFFDSGPMDMVAIGTPSGLHGAHGAAAARRGIHVLVEKPIEITTARTDALIADACRAGVTLGVIFQDRMKPDIRALKSLIDEVALGDPLIVRAMVPWWRPPEYYRESRWRGTWALDGGGALMNQGIHTVDLLLWLCGPVARVWGKAATQFHEIEVEDTAVALLEFENGAVGTLEATTCAYPGRPRQIEISGSKGTAILEGDQLTRGADGPDPTGVRHHRGVSDTPRWCLTPEAGAPQNVASPVVSDVSAHRAVFVDFIHAYQHGTTPCCGGREARRSVHLIEAIYESSRTDRPIEVRQA
jgi:UDP-N-acetyl-2-amino-2-deoxyglucuronate dehydrogenase